MLEFAGPLVSKLAFDPQCASVFDRYAASTRSVLDMFRLNLNTKFAKDKKPIKIRPATQNTQRVEISIRNATRRKRSGSGPLHTPATCHKRKQKIAFQKGLDVCYCLCKPLAMPGSDPGPVQIPSRVRKGPVQIRHVLCFTAFRAHPFPGVGGIPARPGPIPVPCVPLRCRSLAATFAFLQCGSHFDQKLRCNKQKTTLQRCKSCVARKWRFPAAFLWISGFYV